MYPEDDEVRIPLMQCPIPLTLLGARESKGYVSIARRRPQNKPTMSEAQWRAVKWMWEPLWQVTQNWRTECSL